MSIYPAFDVSGRLTEAESFASAAHPLEGPITIKGFSATYDRKFNLGNFENLNPAITAWVKTTFPEGEVSDLHDCKYRLRQMTRDNVRAQLQRLQGDNEVVYLGLPPPASGEEDPIFVRTVSVSLVYKVNLGDYNMCTPGCTDWADLRHVAHSPGELHVALERMWSSLWANIEDEIARTRGNGATGAFLGLPQIPPQFAGEDLTAVPAIARKPRADFLPPVANGNRT